MKKLELEKALQQYRILHTPTQFSIYQFWANQSFSNDSLLECSEEEQKQFYNRIEASSITFCRSIRDKTGEIGTIHNLLDIIMNPKYKNVKKADRLVVYTSNDGMRPIGSSAFDKWSGFQVIDMDIKNREHAIYLKKHIFRRLVKYNWFLGIAFSSSGAGLHIYTKIRVDDNNSPQARKLLYLSNFRHKYSFVYLACTKIIDSMINSDESPVTKEQLLKWMDFAMYKPQQGAFIGYDDHPLINTHFFEDFIYVNFDNVEDMGHPDIDWVTYPDLAEAFKRWEWFEENDKPADVEIIEVSNRSAQNPVHYKHNERWKLANTLVSLYGEQKGFEYLRSVCTSNIPSKELRSDCTTAARHKKPIDLWAINQLNKYHGFKIKVKIDQQERDIQDLYDNIDEIDNPTVIRASKNTEILNISKNQYLSDIRDVILSKCGMISLIEAGAGVGKTEMIKQLVQDGNRVMLIMPFTSTLRAKVDNMPNWSCFYGNKTPKFNDGNRGVAMTLDKFSRLNMMELSELGFDYIVIDESHLLFQSEYRDVMPKVINKIRNTNVPIILMSGTPVGETVFFNDIIHLKVIKEDVRQKKFTIFLTPKPFDNLCHMCRSMAKDIYNNRRVIFPTNKGTTFSKQIESVVKYFLEREFNIQRDINVRYYKKANVGEDFMDKINIEKTIADTDILMCSTYLNVGVDILDKFDFNIYFDELWMPQEIEQFANRLRSHDLFIKLFVNTRNEQGDDLNIIGYRSCNFELSIEDKRDLQSIVQICNAAIQRSPTEYTYNPLVQSIVRNSRFIEYNDTENKYYVNEVAYKTIMFERRYREYVQQLPVLVKGMMSYGYEYSSYELKEVQSILSEDIMTVDDIKDLIKHVKERSGEENTEAINEILDLITEERLHIYVDVVRGLYDIRKGSKFYEDEENRIITVRNMEVFEKVVPLFLSLSKMYDIVDIRDIFRYSMNKNGTYNFAEIRRIRKLTNIIYNQQLNRLDIPIKDFLERSHKFVQDHKKIEKSKLEEFIMSLAQKYLSEDSNTDIPILMSSITVTDFYNLLYDLFRCIVNISRPDKQRRVELKVISLSWRDKNSKLRDINNYIDFLDEFLGKIKKN